MSDDNDPSSRQTWLTCDPDEAGAQDRVSTTQAVGPEPLRLVPSDVTRRFLDEGEVGRGGMASIRRAKDRSLLRVVAIKAIDPEVAHLPPAMQRFVEEAQIMGQLEHPAIVPVHEFGLDESGLPYICMKYVKGKNLEETIALAGDRRLDPDGLAELLQVLVKVCDAVAFAHSKGVVHRDLKPANIMVGEFGQVYVMDWGVARTMPAAKDVDAVAVHRPEGLLPDAAGGPVGTLSYMAPEQFAGGAGALDGRSDVFALGAILFHVLTGRPPYEGTNLAEIVPRVIAAEVPDPCDLVPEGAIPQGLCEIVRRATARKVVDRYPSVNALRDDINRFLRGGMHLPSRKFAPGEDIVRQGEMGDEAFIVIEGHCRVLKIVGSDEVLVGDLGPGEVFGETAVLSQAPRTATVRALDHVTVLVVREQTLSDALGLSGWMGKFVRALAMRFRQVDARLYELEHGWQSNPPGALE